MSPPDPLRILVVDDEPPARQRIEDLLERHPDARVTGSFDNGRDAVQALLSDPPDLVFLDVQMPAVTGLDVLRLVGPDRMPPVVFVTAYDQYALQAFEAHAVDYLLKPYTDERFDEAFAHARDLVRLRQTDRLRADLLGLLQASGTGHAAAAVPEGNRSENAPGGCARLAVEADGTTYLVPVDTVDYVTADGAYAVLHIGSRTHLLREPMWSLEARLPAAFFRLHRSTIVRLDRIVALDAFPSGEAVARLADGTDLRVSRSRSKALRQRLGL